MLIVLILTAVALPGAALSDVILYPTADSYVDSSFPNAIFGSLTGLQIWNLTEYGGFEQRTYVGFDVTGAIPAGKVFQSAILSLAWDRISGSPTDITAHEVTGAWTEMGLTWNNQPSYVLSPLDTAAFTYADRWEWDVSEAWPGTGPVSFVLLIPSATGNILFKSRTWGSPEDSPWLQVKYTDRTDVPEPGTLGLLAALALPGWLLARKRRRTL